MTLAKKPQSDSSHVGWQNFRFEIPICSAFMCTQPKRSGFQCSCSFAPNRRSMTGFIGYPRSSCLARINLISAMWPWNQEIKHEYMLLLLANLPSRIRSLSHECQLLLLRNKNQQVHAWEPWQRGEQESLLKSEHRIWERRPSRRSVQHTKS